jgi:hypothetical protein
MTAALGCGTWNLLQTPLRLGWEIQPIDLGGKNEIALGQARDLMCVVGDPHVAPTETDVGMMSLLFRDFPDAMYERQRTLEIGEQEVFLYVMLLDDLPIRQLDGELAEFFALKRRYASAARYAMPGRQVVSRSSHSRFHYN